MIEPLTYVVVALAVVLFVGSVYYAVKDRLMDDRLLAVAGLLAVLGALALREMRRTNV